MEPGVRPAVHGDRSRSGGAVDECRVHAHRADHLLVRGLPRRRTRATCSSATPTRSRPRSSTRSTWAPRQPRSRDLAGRPYDLTVVCGLDVPWAHDGVREFEERRLWMHERYLEHARESGRPWLLVEGHAPAAGRAHGRRSDPREPRERCARAPRREPLARSRHTRARLLPVQTIESQWVVGWGAPRESAPRASGWPAAIVRGRSGARRSSARGTSRSPTGSAPRSAGRRA